MGGFLRDVMQNNPNNFRVFGPDETASNRLGASFEVTDRAWMAERYDSDDHLAADGRVMEILSEHACQRWLEGYLLTGRHGLFSCYEAFIHIVDSMFNQHAKWLKVCGEIPWRRDHNGFSHQAPGFIDHVVNKKADIIRVYLPPDANTLLVVVDRCLKSRNLVNVIVASKQPELQWLGMDAAINHACAGIGMWEWVCNDQDGEPDVVLAAAGDVPTLEMLAAIDILRQLAPELKIRFINVVDLMTLQPREEHPHGLSSNEFDSLFTTDKPIIFAYHGYPWLIHRLAYRRTNHCNLHVRGYKEEGTTTTPFDMVVLNTLDRFHLAMDVANRVPKLQAQGRTSIKKRPLQDVMSRNGRGQPCLLDPHVILDRLHALDAACNFGRLVNVGLRTDEATQLDHALESFNIDFSGFQSRFVEYSRLNLGGDDAVVDILTGAFLLRGRRTTHDGHQRKGQEKCGKILAKLFHN